MAHRLTDEALARIFAARNAGQTLRAIAQAHGISEYTVRLVLAGRKNYARAPQVYRRYLALMRQAHERAQARMAVTARKDAA